MMVKRFVIIALILLFIGSLGLGWVFNEQKKEEQLLQVQQEKLETGLNKVDKLIAGEKNVYTSVENVFNQAIQDEVAKRQRQREKRELINTFSIVCLLASATAFTVGALLWTTKAVRRVSPYLMKLAANILAKLRQKKVEQFVKTNEETEQKEVIRQIQPEESTNIPVCQERENTEIETAKSSKLVQMQTLSNSAGEKDSEETTQRGCGVALLVSDAGLTECQGTTETDRNMCCDDSRVEQLSVKTDTTKSAKNNLSVDDSIEVQTGTLQKELDAFKKMTQAIHKATVERSAPINNTLKELSEQVSAIREYASQQQGRVERLQDGYDWNIIRTFCLKIIHCIDNLEIRIHRLIRQNVPTNDLEEVRDELVFALESSGVEQFEPKIYSDYRGQEKSAEAVKNKQHTDDARLKGKIAEVIRRGYQYVIDEENVKVVRAAQVKLFDCDN